MNNDRHKFRVWDKLCKEYVTNTQMFVGMSGSLYNKYSDGVVAKVDERDYAIEQCTGLCDRNGKLIYEGDKIRLSGSNETFDVYWGSAGFRLRGIWRNEPMDNYSSEIVGNIHEVKE